MSPPKDPTALKELLPAVLARLARESGGGDRLGPIWEDLVGAAIAHNSHPYGLRDGVLVVRVSSARWAAELSAQAPELLARLEKKVGPGYVTRMQFELSPPR